MLRNDEFGTKWWWNPRPPRRAGFRTRTRTLLNPLVFNLKAALEGLTFEDYQTLRILREERSYFSIRRHENPLLSEVAHSWEYLAEVSDFEAEAETFEDDDLYLHQTIRDRAIGFATTLHYDEKLASEAIDVRTTPLVTSAAGSSRREVTKERRAEERRNLARLVSEALFEEGFVIESEGPPSRFELAVRNVGKE